MTNNSMISTSVLNAGMRARIDAVAAVTASVGVGVVLTSLTSADLRVRGIAGGTGSAFVTAAAVSILRRRPPFSTAADRITLSRCVLAGGCATVVVLTLFGSWPARSWPLVLLTVPALLLDGVDGRVARRQGSASEEGARLDMEVDAALLLVLSVPAAMVVGPWALAIGAMRYLFVAASWWRPALRRPMHFSRIRKVVGVLQGVALVVALAPVVPLVVATTVTACALGLLVISFGRDVLVLERSARSAEQPRPRGLRIGDFRSLKLVSPNRSEHHHSRRRVPASNSTARDDANCS